MQFTSMWFACHSIHSGLVVNSKKNLGDYLTQGLNELGKHIPVISVVTDIAQKLVSGWTVHEKAQAVNRIASFCSDMQTAGLIIEILARQLTLTQESEIKKLAVQKLGVFKKIVAGIKALKNTLTDNDIDTVIKELAAGHCQKILDAIVKGTLKPHPTIADLDTLLGTALGKAHFHYQSPIAASTQPQPIATNLLVRPAVVTNTAPLTMFPHTAADTKTVSTTNGKQQKMLVDDLHTTFNKKGIKNIGEKEAAANAEKFSALPAAAAAATSPSASAALSPRSPSAMLVDRKLAEAERERQEAKRAYQSELTEHSSGKQAKIQDKRLQLQTYLSQCLEEQKYFAEQEHTPLFYFKLAFPLKLHELFMRSYLLRFDANLNYLPAIVALGNEEVRSINRFMTYACPDPEKLPNFVEWLSPLLTKGIATIYHNTLSASKTYAEIEQHMQTYLKQLRAALLKSISNAPNLNPQLFATLSSCVHYILTCFINHSNKNERAKFKAKEKIKLYLNTCDEQVKNLSFAMAVTENRDESARLANSAAFFAGNPRPNQITADAKAEKKVTQNGTIIVELTPEEAEKLKGILANSRSAAGCSLM